MTHRLFLCAVMIAAAAAGRAAPGPPPADTVTVETVLARAATYVRQYQTEFAGVVAQETYEQHARKGGRFDQFGRMQRDGDQFRDLKSDLLLVRPEGADRWVQFRDVFEVDGRTIRDRSDRLAKLFLQPSPSTARQVEKINDESSRYNVGPISRNVNVPVLALLVLQAANQHRFLFNHVDAPAAPRDGAWAIEYREIATGTMIRTVGGRDLPVRGRFWIDPNTGRVLGSTLAAEDRNLAATIDVVYELEPALGLFVPRSMHETYEQRADGATVTGEATYSNFRRFQVKVDEKIAPIVKEEPGAPEPSLPDVLARTGEYVLRFEREFAGIVAEESYYQEVRGGSAIRSRSRGVNSRRLKSDLLLVRPANGDTWVQFRDVFEVDGRPVRDRDQRLFSLFLSPNAATAGQLGRIRQESARYNIGSVQRTVNVPVLPLTFLEPANQPRLAFTRMAEGGGAADGKGESRLPASPRFVVSTEVWVVQYREVRPRTFIRRGDGRDMPARGRFWIEPATGRVLMTELVAENNELRARINVSYQTDVMPDLLVPVEMHENYFSWSDVTTIDGTATYGRFRKFQVKVDEKIAPIKQQ
jgi:hypothetical protein